MNLLKSKSCNCGSHFYDKYLLLKPVTLDNFRTIMVDVRLRYICWWQPFNTCLTTTIEAKVATCLPDARAEIIVSFSNLVHEVANTNNFAQLLYMAKQGQNNYCHLTAKP